MIPPEIGELTQEEERLTQPGSSSLPVSQDLEDPDNLDVVSKFLFLLHQGKCLGRPEGDDNNQRCIESCMFARFHRLLECALHYEICEGRTCTEPHCRQAVELHRHWESCSKPTCFICNTAVSIIIDNFCSFLGGRGDKYNSLILQIQGANLATRKIIIKLNVSIN